MNWQQNRNNGMKIIIVKYPLYVYIDRKEGSRKKKKKTSRENFKSLARRLLRESSRDRIEIKQKTMFKGMTDWRKMNNVRNFFQEFIQPVRSNNSLLNDSWVFTVSKCFIFERNGIKTLLSPFHFSFDFHHHLLSTSFLIWQKKTICTEFEKSIEPSRKFILLISFCNGQNIYFKLQRI